MDGRRAWEPTRSLPTSERQRGWHSTLCSTSSCDVVILRRFLLEFGILNFASRLCRAVPRRERCPGAAIGSVMVAERMNAFKIKTIALLFALLIPLPAPCQSGSEGFAQITTPAQLPNAQAGHSYSVTLTAVGEPPFSFGLPPGSRLPPGLSIIHNTGEIVGTPTRAGEYVFTVRLIAKTGNATKTFHLTVLQ